MFFIWGWGHNKVKKYNSTINRKCENCGNERPWDLAEVSTWFTLFFIPIFPHTKKRVVVCPVCQKGFDVSKDEFENLQILTEESSNGGKKEKN